MITQMYSSVAEDDDSNGAEKRDGNGFERSRDPSSLWSPFFLRRPVMVGFLLTFGAILSSLIALFVFTERDNRGLGIETEGSRYYYLWTYGPTAVFMILTAGWTQAEYRAVQLMPWIMMSRGPTSASESIFLDYISDWNVLSLYKSIKRKHYIVSLTIAGSLLLNGLTVFSTGLFELAPVRISKSTGLTVTHKFDGSNFDPAVNDGRAYSACLGLTNHIMDPPIGLHDPYVYPPFQASDLDAAGSYAIAEGHEYEVDLDVFTPSVECHNATAKAEPSTEKFDTEKFREVYKSEGCRVAPKGVPMALISDAAKIGVDADVAGCQGELLNDPVSDPTGPVRPDVSWNVDWRLWASIAPAMRDYKNPDDPWDGWEKREVRGIMCTLGYNISRGPVKIWRQPGQSAILSSVQANDLKATDTIANVTAGKILYAAHQSIRAAADYSMTGSEYIFSSNESREELWNSPSEFATAIEGSYSCIARQIARNSLLVQEPSSVEGTERETVDRLFVRPLSFGFMVALLGILVAIISLLLWFHIPVTVCPRDTGSIGGMATVFAQSPEFMSSFQGSGPKSTMQMANSALGQTQYASSLAGSGTFSVIPQNRPPNHEFIEPIKDPRPVWWRPLSTTWSVRAPVVLVPLAVIIALEVVYHVSKSSHGITLVEGKSSYIHYVWVYIPALIMFAIRCLFQMVEFGARVLHPYIRLRQGAARPDTSILENHMRKIAIYGVFDTIRKRQWALAAATGALLLAAVTPIVVSGLYMVEASTPTSPRNLTQVARWNLGDPNPASGEGSRYYDDLQPASQRMAGMVIHLNLSYPQWTHKDLAFPELKLTETDGSQDQGHIQARIPALRGRLDCRELKDHGCVYKSEDSIVSCDGASECFIEYSLSIRETWGITYFTDASYGRTNIFDGPADCPSDRLLFGKWYPDDTPLEAVMITCNPHIEEVDVDVRFQVPSFSLDPSFEPRVVEGSARENIHTNYSSFPGFYDMGDFLFTEKTLPGGQWPNGLYAAVDSMTQAAISGMDGVPADELLDSAKLISRVNEVWGITMAQLYNSGGRESFDKPLNHSWSVLPDNTVAPTYDAVLYDGRRYLVQSEVSTRILEGVLAAMVVCGVISIALVQTKGVLPKNPCSIAAVASLLHGSRMLEPGTIPSGAEWCDDAELKRRGVFEGRTFSMGWWTADKKLRTGIESSDTAGSDEDAEISRDSQTSNRSSSEHDDSKAGIEQMKQEERFGIDVDFDDERQHLNMLTITPKGV